MFNFFDTWQPFTWIPYSHEVWHVPFRSTCKLFQIAYEGDFGSLCTMTFCGQKVDFWISNVHYLELTTIQYLAPHFNCANSWARLLTLFPSIFWWNNSMKILWIFNGKENREAGTICFGVRVARKTENYKGIICSWFRDSNEWVAKIQAFSWLSCN